MSNSNETEHVITDAKASKKRLRLPRFNRPTGAQIRNTALAAGAGALAVLAVQKKTGKTADLSFETPDIAYDDSNSDEKN
jgi:hypothetical protein